MANIYWRNPARKTTVINEAISITSDTLRDLCSSRVTQMADDTHDDEILLSVLQQSRAVECKPKTEETSARAARWTVTGFCGKSKIATSFGHLPIEALRRNDPVRTSDGRYLKVSWLKKIGLDSEFLDIHPEAQPIRIPRNSLGKSMPSADLLLSPAQPVQILKATGISTFKAESLSGCGGILHQPHSQVTYYAFGCETPCAVHVDGLWCELQAEF